MKRVICIFLTIIVMTTSSIPAFADEVKYEPQSTEGQNLYQYLNNKTYELLILRKNYCYMTFVEDFNSNALSLYLLGMTDKLINTGSKPDKKKYMETLVNVIAAYDLDRADNIANQKKMDNLKSLKDYAMDFSEMGKDAVSVLVGSSSQVSALENELNIAVSGVYTLADNTDNWIEAISNLETITQDYSEHDAFLALIENEAEGELREAASTLRSGMSSAFKIKLDTYADVSNENFRNYEEFFFSDVFFEVVKNMPEYENDEALKLFTDAGDSVISKIGTLNSAWNLGKAIGTLVGDVVVGGENLINRTLEMMAIYDISLILQDKLLDVHLEFIKNVGKDKERELAEEYISFSNYLIGCRLRGEYCLYSTIAKDAGLLSWFNKESAEEAESWYNNKTEKILNIQKELLRDEDEDTWKVIKEDTSSKNYDSYKNVIDILENEYGSLTLTVKEQYKDVVENITEVNGLCYLSLIDFNNDGVKELLAVAKHERDPEYTVMVYTEENGQAVQRLSSTKLTDASWTGDYLCLLSDKNNHTYIDRKQWGGEWDYDEIYGYEEGEFKLISNSCRAYNFEKGEWDNYLVEEVPDVVDPMKLNRKLISQDEYEKKAPLATGASNIEPIFICLAIPDKDIESGNYYGFDFKALQDSIDRVKEELAGSTASQSVDSREAENNTAYLDVLKKYKGYIKSWERRIKEYNEWYEDVEYLYDERQIAIIDINGDGIDELLFVANTDAQTNEGWEEYVKDLYIFTLQNGQASKILQEKIYTEAAGGYRYLILKTTDNQLVVLDTGIDEFEDCSMDRYSLQGNHFNKEEHRELYYNPYPYGDEPMYSINMDGEEKTVTEREFESTIQSLSKDFETVLIKSGGGVELSIYGIQDEKEAISMTYAEALDYLGGKEDENDFWKQSYIDYIETDPDIAFNPDWCTCGLIYVDDDEIPELIIEYSNEADGTRIVSYKNENTVSYQFSRTGGISYYEREGIINNSIGSMGVMRDQFALLDGEGFHDQGSGLRYDESEMYSNYTYFNWNGEDVSEEDYYANIDWFDDERAKKWNTYSEEFQNNNYSPSEMCEYLLR